MVSRCILAIVLIYVVWATLDYLVHGVLLTPQYEATGQLWLPQDEMRMGLQFVVRLVSVAVFVLIYGLLIEPKNVGRALLYGLLYGIASGASMGYGSYSVMPITYEMGFLWFANVAFQMILAGIILGLLVKGPSSA